MLLARCLSAVARLNPAPAQVIVVDNSKGDADTRKLAHEFGASYTLEPKAGLSHARKRGLAECLTEAVAFLDDDATPEPDWLSTLSAPPAGKKSTGQTEKVVLNIESRGRKYQKSNLTFGKRTQR